MAITHPHSDTTASALAVACQPLPTKMLEGLRYYDERPSEPRTNTTFLLIHGLGGSLDFWTSVAPDLAAVARTIAIDMPWFGLSPGPPVRFSLEAVAMRVIDFCRAAGVARCVLVAHSLGSVVAFRIAAAAPDLFERVVLVSGTVLRAAEITSRPWKGVWAPVLTGVVATQFIIGSWRVPQTVARWMAHNRLARLAFLWPFVAHPARLDPDRLAAGIANTGGLGALRTLMVAPKTDYIALLAAVPQPVDLIWGQRDRLVSDDDVTRTRGLVQVERTHRIDDCAHWPMIENPAPLREFLLDAYWASSPR